MRYTHYVILNASIAFVFFVFLAVLFVLLLGPVGFLVALVFGLFLLLGLALSVAWAHRAVTEFHGSPFPGIWGVLGFNIEPDEADVRWGSVDSGGEYSEGSTIAPPDLPREVEPPEGSAGRLPSPPAPQTWRVGCPKCGGVTDGSDSRFCRMCGERLPPPLPR